MDGLGEGEEEKVGMRFEMLLAKQVWHVSIARMFKSAVLPAASQSTRGGVKESQLRSTEVELVKWGKELVGFGECVCVFVCVGIWLQLMLLGGCLDYGLFSFIFWKGTIWVWRRRR